jgi:hypothetical protein
MILLLFVRAILWVPITFWTFMIRSWDSSAVAAKIAEGDDCDPSLADRHGNRAGARYRKLMFSAFVELAMIVQ